MKKDEEELIEKLVKMSMHKDFHIPIIGYAFNEKGIKVLTKIVERWEVGCYYCEQERPKPL